MFERWTDRARKVLQLANQHARRWKHDFMTPEVILMGLIEEGSGVAVNVIKNLGIDPGLVRLELVKVMRLGTGPESLSAGKQPMTPAARKVIEQANEYAREQGKNYVGTEMILMGLIRDPSDELTTVPAMIFRSFGVTEAKADAAITAFLGTVRQGAVLKPIETYQTAWRVYTPDEQSLVVSSVTVITNLCSTVDNTSLLRDMVARLGSTLVVRRLLDQIDGESPADEPVVREGR